MDIPIFKLEITANTVAWYGAVVATSSILISFLNFLNDRDRVRVRYQRSIRVTPGGQYNPEIDYTFIEVINLSRRPITIKTVGGEYLGGNGFIASNSLRDGQVTIDAGKNYQVLLEESIIQWDRMDSFVAYGVTGKLYRANVAIFYRRWMSCSILFFKRLWNKDK